MGDSPISQFLDGSLILTKIKLGADQNDGGRGGMVRDLGIPLQRMKHNQLKYLPLEGRGTYLGSDVLETRRRNKRETY